MPNPNAPLGGIKLSANVNLDSEDAYLRYLVQIGVTHCYTWLPGLADRYEELARFRDKLTALGLTLYNAGDYGIAKSPRIHLGLPGREEDFDAFRRMLATLGRLGLTVTTFTWEPDQVWSTGQARVRGGALARAVDARLLETAGLRHGRVYDKDELWRYFSDLMAAVLPAAEEAGVRLALHPNDPPLPRIAGVDCLITSAEDYRKAFRLAGSPYLGMEFCCGCWLEGGADFGDLLAGIREFVSQGRVLVTHFRNVSSTLPAFHETLVDEGYADMLSILQAFYEAGYDGTLILDHLLEQETPDITLYGGTGYALGYIKALMNVASRRAAGRL